MGLERVIIDGFRQRAQKRRFFHAGSRCGQHRYPLSPVEHAVAGGAIADAAPQQLLFAGKKHRPGRAHAQYHGFGFQHVVFRQQQEAFPIGHDLADQRAFFFRAQRQRLLPEALQQFLPGYLRQAGIIIDPLRAAQPAAHSRRSDDNGAEAAHSGRHGAGPACGAIADNRYIHTQFLLCHSIEVDSV